MYKVYWYACIEWMTYGPIAMPMFSSYAERIEQRFQTIVRMHDLVTPQGAQRLFDFWHTEVIKLSHCG